MTGMTPLVSPLFIDSYLGFRRILNGYNPLMVDNGSTDNHRFMKIISVAPMGELWI
jgi:hypothetical protein